MGIRAEYRVWEARITLFDDGKSDGGVQLYLSEKEIRRALDAIRRSAPAGVKVRVYDIRRTK